MVSYVVDSSNGYRAYRQTSFKVRLGEGINETGALQPEPIRRTVESLRVLRDLTELDSLKTVLPIATSAVREAANGEDFLRQVARDTGFRFRVLSPEEEALLSYAGAVGHLGFPDTVFFDLGGGSLEILRSSRFRVKKIISLPVGALRLSYQYGRGDGTFTRVGLGAMKQRLSQLIPGRESMRVNAGTRLVGVGGTLRALVRLDQTLKRYPFNKIHNYRLSYEAVDRTSRMLLKMSRAELSDLDAVSNRVVTIAAGAYVVKALMRKLNLDELVVSSSGLRDGALSVFLRNPGSFHFGKVTRMQAETYVASAFRARNRGPNSVDAFQEAGLIDEHQRDILYGVHRLVHQVTPTNDLQALFYSILGVDSPFSHGDQLLVALLAVSTQNRRAAGVLLEEYRRYLERRDRKSLPRLSTVFALTQTVEQSGAKIKLALRGNTLKMSFHAEGSRLPVGLLKSRAEELGEAYRLLVVPSASPIRGQLNHRKVVGASARWQ